MKIVIWYFVLLVSIGVLALGLVSHYLKSTDVLLAAASAQSFVMIVVGGVGLGLALLAYIVTRCLDARRKTKVRLDCSRNSKGLSHAQLRSAAASLYP